jgi:Leucine-rich repeat (LRR) protein
MGVTLAALERIINCIKTGASELDLSNCGLTEIPNEIFDIESLVSLKLGESFDIYNKKRNHIFYIPKKICKLKNLEFLDVRFSSLVKLPSEIGLMHNLKYLFLNNNQLVEVPKEIWHLQELIILDLQSNHIRNIEYHDIKSRNMQGLYLNNNLISSFNLNFEKFSSLKVICLRNNRLLELSREINKIKSLEILDVTGNKIEAPPEGIINKNNVDTNRYYGKYVIDQYNYEVRSYHSLRERLLITKFRDLEVLDLSNMGLKNIPYEVFYLENIRTLNLENNHINFVPHYIGILKNLKELNLRSNNISTIPEEIFSLEYLAVLDLSNNNIDHLSEALGKLLNLRGLSLSGNQLTSLPPEIGELKQLEILSLSGNKLQYLPKEIGELKNLKTLGLGENLLASVPDEVKSLKNLESLGLRDNQFTCIPESICNIENIIVLILKNNQIDSIPDYIVHLHKIKKLHIGNNRVRRISPEIDKLNNLRELYLNNNSLYYLPYQLAKLSSIKVLDLTGNPLKDPSIEIIEGGFPRFEVWGKIKEAKEKQLVELNLNDCGLTEFPKEIFDLYDLKKLVVEGSFISNTLFLLKKAIKDIVCLEDTILNFKYITDGLEYKPQYSSPLCLTRSYFDEKIPNQINLIPKDIEKLENLEELFLSENKLDLYKINSANISFLKKLKKLDLSQCNLTQIPEMVFKQENLIELNLSNSPYLANHANKIEIIPDEISNLSV